MIVFKALSIWIMMGLLSWAFVYLVAVFTMWLTSRSPNSELSKDALNKSSELITLLTNINSFVLWILRGPLMMILVIKSIIEAIIE